MISIFSVHMTVGLVDPQFTSDEFAKLLDMYAMYYSAPIGPGMTALTLRPEPENEEEEVMQAISPGTHEINIIFDFDPNEDNFLKMLVDDTIYNRYNIANQLSSMICISALKKIECAPTYFTIKISGDYIDDELYKKIRKQRFKL